MKAVATQLNPVFNYWTLFNRLG